jgi:ribosomal protein S18 acetylase RimI-like enzyme
MTKGKAKAKKLTVRPAQRDELAAVATLVVGQPLLMRYGATAAGLTRDLNGALDRGEPVLVADDGQLHGFAWFLRNGTFAQGGYLRLIALAPGAEGRGMGRALLQEVERQVAEHSRNLFLMVSHWNEGARRFYAARGYSEVGRLPAFIRPDTDEIICWKRLR